MRLKDKAILITGATGGIGHAIARACLAEGAAVMIHGLDDQTTARAASSLGPAVAHHAADLADARCIPEFIQAAVAALGRIDALVNNAAAVVRSDIQSTDSPLFDRVMAVNVRAPLLLIHAALEHLEQSHGAVLNIGSVNAYCGEPNLLAYSISKGALMTLTRNLADALGPGACVSTS